MKESAGSTMGAGPTGPRISRTATLPTYGRDLLAALPRGLFERPLVLTQPEPWALVRAAFPATAAVHVVETMERSAVEARSSSFPAGTAVFGVGGGSAIDHAKYVAWRRGLPLVLVPTILSVDAAYTKAVAVREGGRVRYVGEVWPDHLLVDFDLLRAAPPLLNRAGAGDILSIFTALWDWREAGERLGESYDAGIAVEARVLLDRLLEGGAGLRDAHEDALTLLSECYAGEVQLCEDAGSARPEEGSEHYVAYAVEALTKRGFVHGQLVGLGVLVAGAYQGQDTAPIARFLRDIGLDCRPAAVGVTRDELRTTLLGMGDYVRQETQLLPGVFHFRGAPSAAEAERLMDVLEEAVP